MENEFPRRKHPRLKNYDYSSPGAYFITICVQKQKCILSSVSRSECEESEPSDPPAELAKISCTKYGIVAERELRSLETRYPYLKVDQYVIMPNHIHVILILDNKTAGASPRPTVEDIICAYKSLTTKECKKIGLTEKLFQTSFYEHVVRDRKDYEVHAKYIQENPLCWYYDELYAEE
ncbi:MAG: transposase [Clostridia bacterium]|nr:transposase [Clostridia bacterium]